MPAAPPPITDAVAARLAAIGSRVRAQRKGLRVSATAAAEAAGMSRVTLHRIERGEPSVAMGSYMSAAAALGLAFDLQEPRERRAGAPAKLAKQPLPRRIRLADYPQLARLAWQLHGVAALTPKAALDLYERNWRHVDRDAMDARERELVQRLADELGGGRLLV